MNSNQRKAETLGIPHGTAQNKLRKKIIFALISEQLAAGNVCFVCKETIQSDDDMTIEHIKPWEGRENGKDLFWDLDNIAFSHKWCNRPHTFREGKPENWCYDCNKEVSMEDKFYGKMFCKAHWNERKKEYRSKGGVH